MAQKLSIQVALEGGAEIARELADIGQAGQKAFADIAKSAEEVGGFKNLKPEEVTDKLKTMGLEGTAAFEKIQKAVQAAGRLETLVSSITTVENALLAMARAAPAVGAAIVAAMTAAAKATIAFAETISKASDEAAKLGLTLEKFQQGKKFFEDLGISSATAADGVRALTKAAEQASFDNLRKAAAELKDFGERGFGAQGTAQLKLLEEAAKGTGEQAQFARKTLLELGLPIPTDGAKTLQELSAELGNGEKVLAAFKKQLESMPPGLDRLNAATAVFGQKAGTALVQSIRAANGEMGAAELKAYQLQTAFNALSTVWEKFGSVAFAPAITSGINLVTNALQTLDAAINNFSWPTFASAGAAAFSLLQGFINNFTLQGLATQFASFSWNAFTSAGRAAFSAIVSAAQQAGQAVLNFAASLPGISWDAIKSAGEAAWNAIVTAVQGAGTAITTFVSSLGSITWDAIKSAGEAAWNAIVTAVQRAGTAITTFVSSLGSITWDAISSAGVAAWNAITGAIQGAIDKLLQFIGLKPSAPAAGGGAPGKAAGGLLGGRGTGTSDSNLAWVSRGEYVMPAAAVRQPGVLAFLEALRRSGDIPGYAEGGFIHGVAESSAGVSDKIADWLVAIATANNEMRTGLNQVVVRINDLANGLTDKLFNVVNSMTQALNLLSSGGRLAHGGLLGGRGSGTSDSNLAWLSRGEHIMPARAVAQPGVLAFLEALRRSGGNLRGVLDGMGRFALGGMIRGPMPAFASGGLAGSMSNVTIQFPGLPAIGGLRASSDVVDQLHKAAALAQVRSGGRKPSRYS